MATTTTMIVMMLMMSTNSCNSTLAPRMQLLPAPSVAPYAISLLCTRRGVGAWRSPFQKILPQIPVNQQRQDHCCIAGNVQHATKDRRMRPENAKCDQTVQNTTTNARMHPNLFRMASIVFRKPERKTRPGRIPERVQNSAIMHPDF